MKNSWKRLLTLLCSVCMSVFAGFALSSCKDPDDDSSPQSSVEHVHTWNDGVVQSTSTCTTKGATLYTCTSCGEVKTEYAPYQHSYVEAEVVEATCTEKGYTVSRCSTCKDEIRSSYVDAKGHDYETSVQPMTCTSHEITTYSCKNCDEEYTEITQPTTGHQTEGAVWKTVVSETPISGSNCEYAVTEETTCTVANCGATVTRTLSETVHKGNYSHQVTTPATCVQTGVITYTCSCGNDDYTYTETYTSTAHSWDNGTTNGSVTTYACTNSGCTHTKQTVAATLDAATSSAQVSASALSAVSADNAKSTEVQVTENTSMQMDSALLSTLKSSSATNITFVAEELSESANNLPSTVDTTRLNGATVYNFGLTDGTNPIAFNGGSMTVTVPYTLAAGEDPTSITVLWLKEDGTTEAIKASYDADTATATFTVDHFSYYTVVRMTAAERCKFYGHQEKTMTLAPTCTQEGYTLTVCTRCGWSQRTNVQSATGHNYVAKTVAATCTERGYTRYACENTGCNDAYVTAYTEQLAHSYVDTVVAPTCTEKGHTAHICSGCGKTYRDNYTVPNGHTYENGACKDCGEEAPEEYVNANNFYFNLIQSIAQEDSYYIEVEDISFTAELEMAGVERTVTSEVDMYRLTYKLDKDGYIVGQGEGKVKATMVENQNGQSETTVEDMEMTLVFQNGKVYLFQKRTETEGKTVTSDTYYEMTSQDEMDISDMQEMYEAFDNENLSNILKGMMSTENNPVNTVIAAVTEYIFTKTETTDGYVYRVNHNNLPAAYDMLTEETVATMFDAIFGENAYNDTYAYILALPDKTVEQVRTDIVAWCLECGVQITDVYAVIDNMLNSMGSSSSGGSSGSGGIIDGGVVDKDESQYQPMSATTETEEETISVEQILTEYKDYTISQILDMMMGNEESGRDEYVSMIQNFGEMFTNYSLSEIVIQMGTSGSENASAMQDMIEEVMTFVETQITSLVASLNGTVNAGFTTDKSGNLLTMEASFENFEHSLTVDSSILSIFMGEETEEEIPVSVSMNGSVSVVMGGSYIADYDEIVAALEKSKSIFDIKAKLSLTKEYESHYSDGMIFKYSYDFALVPTEAGVMYVRDFDSNKLYNYDVSDRAAATYNGTACESYKVTIYGDSSKLLAPESGVRYSESCSGWKKYTSDAYYCSSTIYTVYVTETNTVLGYELAVDEMLENKNSEPYGSVTLYYNAGLNQYSLNEPHNYVLTDSKIPQVCEEEGYYAYRCTVCGKEKREHLYKDHNTELSYQLVDPDGTCEDGVKQVWTCTVCGKVTSEYELSLEEAAQHPTYRVKEALPGATENTCSEHYLSYYVCACGEEKGEVNVAGGTFGYVTTLWSDSQDGKSEQYYGIYRCSVTDTSGNLKCGYTYAREYNRVYNTDNCTETEVRKLYAGITFDDETQTITSYGKEYDYYSYIREWHETTSTKTEDGNIDIYTHICNNCGQTTYVTKYERISFTNNGSQSYMTRQVYYFDYIDGYGYEYEYDEYCNRTRYSLTMENGQIVRSGDGYNEGIYHTDYSYEITEPTCTQFGERKRICVACNSERTYMTSPTDHSYSYNSELDTYICNDCGMTNATGADGAFTLSDLTAGGTIKLGYFNKYNREYKVYVYVNYNGEAIDLTDYCSLEELIEHVITYRTQEDLKYDGNWYWGRECGMVTFNMTKLQEVLAQLNSESVTVNTLTVVFETEYNYETEDGEYEDSLQYGINFEIGYAGTYKLAAYGETSDSVEDVPEDAADDYVITLNNDFTYTMAAAGDITVFSEAGDWQVVGNTIRLYDENGSYVEIDSNLCLWDQYGYWYFEKA